MNNLSCANCKYGQKRNPNHFVGRYCTKIVHVTSNTTTLVYFVGEVYNNNEVYLIVQEDFLCKLWEPIDD